MPEENGSKPAEEEKTEVFERFVPDYGISEKTGNGVIYFLNPDNMACGIESVRAVMGLANLSYGLYHKNLKHYNYCFENFENREAQLEELGIIKREYAEYEKIQSAARETFKKYNPGILNPRISGHDILKAIIEDYERLENVWGEQLAFEKGETEHASTAVADIYEHTEAFAKWENDRERAHGCMDGWKEEHQKAREEYQERERGLRVYKYTAYNLEFIFDNLSLFISNRRKMSNLPEKIGDLKFDDVSAMVGIFKHYSESKIFYKNIKRAKFRRFTTVKKYHDYKVALEQLETALRFYAEPNKRRKMTTMFMLDSLSKMDSYRKKLADVEMSVARSARGMIHLHKEKINKIIAAR